jgi:hypothetical protein
MREDIAGHTLNKLVARRFLQIGVQLLVLAAILFVCRGARIGEWPGRLSEYPPLC